MLVLSRRENEKVLFPTLGISIEVIRANSNKVQLGIDAPREIRVIRDELQNRPDPVSPQVLKDTMTRGLPDASIRSGLKSAALAIHLAKNQIRQGLDHQAGDALDEAIGCLKQIEQRISSVAIQESLSKVDSTETVEPVAAVCESRSRYRMSNDTDSDIQKWQPFDLRSINALVEECFDSLLC